MYAFPANLSPVSKEYKALVDDRVNFIKEEHPQNKGKAIPVSNAGRYYKIKISSNEKFIWVLL